MPQTVYETLSPNHPVDTFVGAVPNGWAYIGEEVWNDTQPDPPWTLAHVLNNVGNAWVRLNADLDKVDYALHDVKHDRLIIDIHDHLNWDFLWYHLDINPVPAGMTMPATLPDDFDYGPITGLTQLTTYTFNVRAELVQGGTTNDSIQTITTPENPIPKAPISLRSPSRSNSWIDLAWDDPVGSTAVKWRVYVGIQGQAANRWGGDHASRAVRVTGLQEDKKYFYYVTGVNVNGLEGPASNMLRWATGHSEKRRVGSIYREPLWPLEWGSWRPDIGWYDWHVWPRKQFHSHIYQGYWQKDPIWTGSTEGINRPEEEKGRYRGCITYNQHDFRVRMDNYFGGGVWQNIGVSCVEVRKVYRQSGVGTVNKVHLEWYLTNTNVYDSGEPPIYFGHRNTSDSPDAVSSHDTMKAGQAIEWLRLPRGYGHALITGTGWYGPGNGVSVNGLMLYQGGHVNTGAGAAGYGRWSGHGAGSDWTILVTASWNFPYVNYQAPYQW